MIRCEDSEEQGRRRTEYHYYGNEKDRKMIIEDFFTWLLSEHGSHKVYVETEDKDDWELRISWKEIED